MYVRVGERGFCSLDKDTVICHLVRLPMSERRYLLNSIAIDRNTATLTVVNDCEFPLPLEAIM